MYHQGKNPKEKGQQNFFQTFDEDIKGVYCDSPEKKTNGSQQIYGNGALTLNSGQSSSDPFKENN